MRSAGRTYGSGVASPDPEVHRITGADPGASEVHRITDAGIPLSQDQAHRQHAYIVAMSIRTACFVGAVLAPGGAGGALLNRISLGATDPIWMAEGSLLARY